ncbi:MAG: histidine kinase [Desulfosalsimonadaceae bacterium]|nr:histidine kinase [Desulfosalsimonadaceae bacterium]
MHLSLLTIDQKAVVGWYGFIIAINLVLGLFFWAVRISEFGLSYHLISSQVGGFITLTTVLSALYVLNPIQITSRFMIIIISVVMGSVMAAMFSIGNREMFFINLLFGTLIGSIIYGSAFYWESMAITKSNLEKAQVRRLQMEKRITEAKLMALQAQIEPHFLFNTLSNILNLFDTDMEKGKSMQQDLILYLESSLSKIRTDLSTIGDEINLVVAYLNIFKVRLEERLQYETNIPDCLKKIPFPPMLIQPLVENAIQHGIEPKVEGGRILISVETRNHAIQITVADTGLGMNLEKGARTGLANIRERLHLLYGSRGHLRITENHPCGVKAIIEVPGDIS